VAELSDEDLLDALGVFAEPEKQSSRTAREERVVAGFEDIQRFVDKHGHAPMHGEDRNIFERLYAVRLDRIRALPDCRAILAPLDRQGLLEGVSAYPVHETAHTGGFAEEGTDDALLAELGVAEPTDDDITVLRHVRPRAEVRAAKEIGSRTACKDFDTFKPMFLRVQKDLEAGAREARALKKPDDVEYDQIRLDAIQQGAFFIVGGQKAYVAEVGEVIEGKDRRDAKIRVIYDNGTEADFLMRSFQRSLYRDPASRVITEANAGPLFSGEAGEDDSQTGTVYVLRSQSNHEMIAGNRDLVHKIGVTGNNVASRISNAALDATYLMADVDIVATYTLYNVNRAKLEHLIHRFFSSARLDIEIPDRFGNRAKPKEWYLVPLSVIDEMIEKIVDGTISDYEYQPERAGLAKLAK
jgi:T5orf172 domain